MADIKISQLPAASSASGSQEFEINDSGTSRRVTGSQLESFVKSNLVVSDITDLTATAVELNQLDGNIFTGTVTAGDFVGSGANLTGVVTTAGTQSVAGVKTFTDGIVAATSTLTSPAINTSISGTAIASQLEAEAGTATDKLMTPERTAQHFAAAEQQVGVNQTWQNVIGSRTGGVTYQNTTGRVIAVFVRYSTGTASNVFQVSSNGVNWIDLWSRSGSAPQSGTAEIPDGHYYRTTASGNINNWVELR
jgi:hypothetical protein